MICDSPHHVDWMSCSGGNPSDLAADCPLLETGYPVHIWNLAGMLCFAYKKKKQIICIFIDSYSYMIP